MKTRKEADKKKKKKKRRLTVQRKQDTEIHDRNEGKRNGKYIKETEAK